MTREDFISRLPATISHRAYGDCRLAVVEETRIRKGVCYMNSQNYKVVFKYGRSWEILYRKMSEYLKKEGFVK